MGYLVFSLFEYHTFSLDDANRKPVPFSFRGENGTSSEADGKGESPLVLI